MAQNVETVELADSGAQFELWRGPSSSAMRIDWTRSGAVRITVVGHGHATFSPPAIKVWEACVRLSRNGKSPNFIDFWGMPTYDSGMRQMMTDWALKFRDKTEFHVITISKLVSMGLTVANIPLSGALKIYSKKSEFDAMAARHGLPSNPAIT